MLNGLTAKTEARRISLSVSRPSLASAQIADVVAGFYRGRPAGAATGGVGAITEGMLGMPEGGPAVTSDKPVLATTLEKKSADGSPAYTSAITGLVGTAESAVLIRNLLLAQHDGNAAIVLAGPADRRRPAARPLSVGSADCGEVQAAGGGRRIVPVGRARRDDQGRHRRGKEAVRRVARRRSWPSDRKSATRCRTRARASRRILRGRPFIRSSTPTAPSSRCPTMHRRRARRRALRRPSG